jgi:hypothetical protein
VARPVCARADNAHKTSEHPSFKSFTVNPFAILELRIPRDASLLL